jgi:hypothetical protein
MDWEIIGATGEWAGAVAVVVTLFYLARQIRQSNILGSADAEREWFTAWHEILRGLGSDLETGDIFQRGLQDYGALERRERTVFHGQVAGIFNHTDLARRLHQKGLIPNDMMDALYTICLRIVVTEGGRDFWTEMGPGFPLFPHLESYRADHEDDVRPFNHDSVWSASN